MRHFRVSDIDECLNQSYECDSTSYCVNSPGSYDCQCKQGYTKNAKNQCEGNLNNIFNSTFFCNFGGNGN